MNRKILILILGCELFFGLVFYTTFSAPIVNPANEPTTKTITLKLGQIYFIKRGDYCSDDYITYSGRYPTSSVPNVGIITFVDFEWISTGSAGASAQYYVYPESVLNFGNVVIKIIDFDRNSIKLEITQ